MRLQNLVQQAFLLFKRKQVILTSDSYFLMFPFSPIEVKLHSHPSSLEEEGTATP